MPSHNVATLSLGENGKTIELPILSGNEGHDVIDIRSLYKQSGMFTYDPGFVSTASCKSAITFIDGDQGILLYRGYPIEQLATRCDFMEVSYLLLNGNCQPLSRKRNLSATSKPYDVA